MPRQRNIQHDAMNEPLNTDSVVGATRSSRATTCLREALAIFVGGADVSLHVVFRQPDCQVIQRYLCANIV